MNHRMVPLSMLVVPLLALAGPLDKEEKFPEKKWFQNGKGYAEALEVQKATGADLFVYFARYYPNDEEGLCRWFEKRGLQHPTVEKALRPYVKVKFAYPLNKDDTALTEPYRVNKCPAVFVVATNGWRHRVQVFEWQGGKKPDLLEPDALVALIRENSGPRYRLPTDPAGQ